MNLIVDSDFGVDDTLCIEYLKKLHDNNTINLIGITTNFTTHTTRIPN